MALGGWGETRQAGAGERVTGKRPQMRSPLLDGTRLRLRVRTHKETASKGPLLPFSFPERPPTQIISESTATGDTDTQSPPVRPVLGPGLNGEMLK